MNGKFSMCIQDIHFHESSLGSAVVTNQINYKKRSRVGDKAFLGTSRKFNGRRNPYFPRLFTWLS